jgi:glycerol kinase
LFAGYEHEQQTKRLAVHFNLPLDYYATVACDSKWLQRADQLKRFIKTDIEEVMLQHSVFENRDLNNFANYEEAYHQLIADIMVQQLYSTNLVLRGTQVKRIFVDGGFSKNPIFMHMIADCFPEIEVFAATVAQASSLGAALAMHQHWNSKSLPSDIIELKNYN